MPENTQGRKPLKWLKVSQLWLDDQNFRFPEDARGASQEELLIRLDRDFELLSIGQSLAENGYFTEEPLVVIPKAPSDQYPGQYIVVEGNRRLAALKLLLDEKLRHLSQDAGHWHSVASDLKGDLSEVPAVEYESRDKVRTVLGYRHIAGILKWKPLAKARFINSFIEEQGEGADFGDAAREIGSWPRVDYVRNQYVAYRAYLQARDGFQIDTSKLDKNFSVFYRAITAIPKITRFIDLCRRGTAQELASPVPQEKRDVLEELIGFIHGTAAVEPVITDHRQLKQLGDVLASDLALETLRRTRSLQRAHELVGGESSRLLHNLNEASFYLDEVLRDAHRHTQGPKVKELVRRCAETMAEIVRHFPEAQRVLEGGL